MGTVRISSVVAALFAFFAFVSFARAVLTTTLPNVFRKYLAVTTQSRFNAGILCIATVLIGITPCAAQATTNYTLTSIAVPGTDPFYTEPKGINDTGQVVGIFSYPNQGSQGFLYSGGTYTTINAPGAGPQGTFLSGINNAGQIVGSFVDVNNVSHGLLYSKGVFTVIDAPGAGPQGTVLSGINNAGQIVGYFYVNNTSHGLLYSGGAFTEIDVPGAMVTALYGINDVGQIVGIYETTAGAILAFLYSGGTFTTINPTSYVNNDVTITGINNAGQIVGYYFGTGIYAHNFLYSGGTYTTPIPEAPGNVLTIFVFGINNSGQIVGWDDNGPYGFLATPGSGSPPVAVNETATTSAGSPVTINLSAGATGNPTSAALVTGPAYGTTKFISATEVTYTPTTGFSGTDSFQFTLANPYGTSNMATATITVGPPHIIFVADLNQSQAVDATTTPQTVVAGQPISLYAGQVGAPPFSPATGQTQGWLLNGQSWPITSQVTVGGFAPSPSCPSPPPLPPPACSPPPLPPSPPACAGTVTPLPPFTNSSTPTFYWTVPGTYTVSYTYTIAGASQTPVTATFNVEGPKANSSSGQTINASQPGNLVESINCGNQIMLFPTITFTQNVSPPPGNNGKLTWVQIVNSSSISYYNKIASQTPSQICDPGYYYPASYPSLDNTYPYSVVNTQNQASDAPDVILGSTYNKLTDTFEARMYLMWTASAINVNGYKYTQPNIAVPLGYIDWGFSGTIYRVLGFWLPPGTASKFAKFMRGTNYPVWGYVPAYPTWGNVAINRASKCNNGLPPEQ